MNEDEVKTFKPVDVCGRELHSSCDGVAHMDFVTDGSRVFIIDFYYHDPNDPHSQEAA